MYAFAMQFAQSQASRVTASLLDTLNLRSKKLLPAAQYNHPSVRLTESLYMKELPCMRRASAAQKRTETFDQKFPGRTRESKASHSHPLTSILACWI